MSNSRPSEIALPNGVHIELLYTEDFFRGFGAIKIGGIQVRGRTRPMFVEIRTPRGIEFFDYSLKRWKFSAEGVTLEFSMKARSAGLEDWMLHTVKNRWVTRDWAEEEWAPANTTLRLHVKGMEDSYGDRKFSGFSYAYEYESEEHPLYRFMDKSSWGIGESIVGNSLWQRSSFAPPIKHFQSLTDSYSSEWYLGSVDNPNIFQFLPFQAQMEAFTLMSAAEGQLLIVAPELSYIRAYLEKPAQVEEMLHWYEHCGDLSSRFQSAPMHVLFSPGSASRTDLINLDQALRDRLSDELHQQAGMRRERVTTYGIIEEWGLPDFDDYNERILPRMLEAGIKTVMLPNEFENNMNVWGVGNMCCNVDFKVPESIGEEKIKRFCDLVKAQGAEVQMWGNTALSTLNYILKPQREKGAQGRIKFLPEKDSIEEMLKRSKDPYIRNPSNALEADHYTPVFMALNLRDPDVLEYWHRRWKYAHDALGIGGIFMDSSFNMSCDKFHFVYNTQSRSRGGATWDQANLLGGMRPEVEPPSAVLSMYFAYFKLIAEMQSYGYVYCVEDIGLFGLRRAGPGIRSRLGSLFQWADSYGFFIRSEISAGGKDPEDIFFQGLAYRLMWSLFWNFDRQCLSFRHTGGDASDDPTPWQISLLRVFNQLEGRMKKRHVLENEKAVLYDAGEEKILWVFQSFSYDLADKAKVYDVLNGTTSDSTSMELQKNHVYVLTKSET